MARTFLTNIDLSKNELLNARIQQLSTAPSSPVTGQIYYDTDDNLLYFWNGSTWIPASGAVTSVAGRTGAVVLVAADLSDFNTAVRTNRLDQMAAPTGSVSMNSQKITNLLDPTSAQDAATKNYVDGLSNGVDWKASVRVASTANLTLSGAQTIDGVSAIAGDRVLVKNQSTGADNGIYVVAAGSWARATDADVSAEVTGGMAVWVTEGTVNADTGWVLTTNDAITLGSTALVFTQFSGLGQVAAGAGLTKTGSTLDVGQGTGITVNADDVAIDTSVVVRKYAADIGDGSSTAIVVTHSLGTRDVTVSVHDNSTPWAELYADVEKTSINTITLRFAVAPTSNQYRVVVHS